MPTNFPSAVDTYPNQATLAAGTLGSDGHSTLTANMGDAINAIETYLLTGAGNPAPNVLYGGGAPYNLVATTGHGVANRTAFVQLVADCQTQGKIGLLPSFRSGGSPQLMPLAPTALILDPNLGDMEIWAPQGAGFKQVVDPSTGIATISRTPLSGFANDKNGATPPAQNYWIFVDRSGNANNAITWRGPTFQGGHGSNNSPSNPNAGESSWLHWGVGLRLPRRSRLYNTNHGGSWAGIQFDGDFDHTHCECVDSGGNWHNVRFGPRQFEKDNVFVNCSFANSSCSGICLAPTGFLGGSSFFGGHLGTQPYGIYIESGAKSTGLAIQIQNMNFNELIWEGCGNFKIFDEDGDMQLNNIRFHDAQWHGLEVGDHSNIHVKYCSKVTNLARAATGIVTVSVDTLGSISGTGNGGVIAAGDYVVMNGVGSQPQQGIKVGGGAADTSLIGVYKVLTASGTSITMQGSTTTVVASGTVSTAGTSGSGSAFLAKVGAVRAGKLTGWAGNLQITGDEVDSRDQATFTAGATWATGGYGTAAELYFDVVQMTDCRVFDSNYLPNFGPRMAYHAGSGDPSFWETVGGEFLLVKTAGAIPAKSLVQFSGNVGDVVVSTGSREVCGVVGGTNAASHPTSPAGAYVASGDWCWAQDKGIAEVLGSGTTPQGGSVSAAGGLASIADTSGQVATLAAGTTAASGQFKAGKSVGTASVGTSLIKLG